MDRKTEIKKHIWTIMADVYKFNLDIGVTAKQDEFLDKVMDYLESEISLRRKVVKDKPVEKVEEVYVNPDSKKW